MTKDVVAASFTMPSEMLFPPGHRQTLSDGHGDAKIMRPPVSAGNSHLADIGQSRIDLAQRSEPYEIAPPYGLSMTVKPLTTAGMGRSAGVARRAVEAIERQARERTEARLTLDKLPDLSAEGERDGFYEAQLIREPAVRLITSWITTSRSSRF